MAYLVLARHGQSKWNALGKWTGFVDVGLSQEGEEEAKRTAGLIKDITFDRAYTSDLKRSQQTLDIILEKLHLKGIPIIVAPEIKERNYGDLTGLNKWEFKKKYGEKEFLKFRRSWDVRPPNGESLEDTYNRAVPYFERNILQDVKEGKNVLVSAHGNSLRAIVKYLDHLSNDAVTQLEIPFDQPYVYEIENSGKILKKEIRSANLEKKE